LENDKSRTTKDSNTADHHRNFDRVTHNTQNMLSTTMLVYFSPNAQ